MRLTLKTNLAARVLMFCAVNDGRTVRTAEIADRCNASLNHLLQVVGLLQSHGFVETQRGRTGGLRLARGMDLISMGEVFRRMEGEMPLDALGLPVELDPDVKAGPAWVAGASASGMPRKAPVESSAVEVRSDVVDENEQNMFKSVSARAERYPSRF